MTYKRKTVTIARDNFNQLIIYIQQVTETVSVLRERYDGELDFSDWLTAIEIHTEILSKYMEKIIKENGYKENLDLLGEWAKNE